uniref:Breast carcinoma amplified sequence 4 n=2 Tax=Podarcis muralis TaxID=64176 RepID=A0A670IUQ6_PODMU
MTLGVPSESANLCFLRPRWLLHPGPDRSRLPTASGERQAPHPCEGEEAKSRAMRGAAAAALPLWAGGATVPRRRRQGAPRARPAAPGKREPLRIRPTALGCGGVPEPGPEKPLPAASGPSRLPATAMSAAAASERGEASASSTTLSPSAEAGGGHGEPQLRAEEAAAEEEEREARQFALYLAPEAGREGREEVKEIEESIEEMLIRLDEFCGMTDLIRSNTSQLLDEAIPLIKAKVIEMNSIYTKVDKLEAFVKMAGHHVSFLEEQVLEAEKAHAIFPYTVQKLFGSVATPSFKKKHATASQHTYSLPELYRTEDYFPIKYIGSKYQNH